MFNIYNMDWDDQALKIAGVTRDQLPELVDTTYQLKGMHEEYAKVWESILIPHLSLVHQTVPLPTLVSMPSNPVLSPLQLELQVLFGLSPTSLIPIQKPGYSVITLLKTCG